MRKKYLDFLEAREVMQPSELIKTQSIPMRIYRKASIYISYPLARMNVSPNAISYLWIIIGIISALTLLGGGYSYLLAGMLLFQLSLFLDLVDGEIARYRFKVFREKSDVLGHFLDTTGHYIVIALIFICLGAGLYYRFNEIAYFYLGAFTSFFTLLDSFKLKIYENLVYKKKIKELLNKEKDYSPKKSPLKALIMDFLRIDILSLILWAAVFNVMNYILIFYCFAFGLRTLIHGYKAVRYFNSFKKTIN